MAAKADAQVFIILASPGSVAYLVADGAGWALPQLSVALLPGGMTFSAPAITAAVRAALGIETELLLFLAASRSAEDAPLEVVVLLSLLPASSPPAVPLQRMALDDARRAGWNRPEHPAHLAVLDEPPPTLRVSWARPGFLAEAGGWIEAQLALLGLAPTGLPEVRRNWSLSALLRVPTAAGDYYFKAIPALFRQEPTLTAYLAERFPGQVPAVTAIDAERRWLLMPAFNGPPLADEADLAPWLAAIAGYAALQVALVPEAEGLLTLGCPDRRVTVLEGQVAEVLADTDGMLIDQPYGLPAADAARLLALGPALRQACRAFAALPLPPTLEHGDLHGHNIVIAPGGGFTYFDWSDGCLAPPFFGLPAYLETNQAERHAALIAAYTEPWRPFADAATLDRARRLARPLSDLHMALSYVWIRAQTEERQRWQLAGSFPYFLRELLKHWAEVEAEL